MMRRLALMLAALSASPATAQPSPEPPAAPDTPLDQHAGHDMASMKEAEEGEVGNTPAPAPPADRAADAIFGEEIMGQAQAVLHHEIGTMTSYSVIFNLAEFQVRSGRDGYRWEGEGWLGGDIDRFVIKTEGDGVVGDGVEAGEVQALYSRAIDPYFNLQAGIRYDFEPGPSRTYATVGFEGIAPYWFKVEGALFLSDKGDLLGRLEGYYDERITQKLILQPRAEINFAAQDVPANGIGSGLYEAELGLRLRYEIRREFAPYIGVSWEGMVGDAARFARAAGDKARSTSLVLGIRTWF